MIKAQHEQLFAQYRLLDAMGLLVTVVMGDQASYEKMVNINSDNVVYNLDTLPINLDVDGDKIVNHLDICDNSLSSDKDHIMPYGCKKSFFDPNKERTLKALKNNKIFEKGEK